MCRHTRRVDRTRYFEGPTMQLGEEIAVSRSSHNCMRSPWHLLWLIWPLTMLVKWLMPTLSLFWATLTTRLFSVANAQLILATVLIVAGLVLVLRRDRGDSHPYD